MKRGLMAVWVVTLGLCVGLGWASPALSQSFTETFDGSTLDATRWLAGGAGGASWQVSGGHLVMTLGNGVADGVGFGLVQPVTGDFMVTMDFQLLNWRQDSKARLVLNAYHSDGNQVGALRMSDQQYDTPYPWLWPPNHRWGEVYMASADVLGWPTDDSAGTLKLQRSGDTVVASYRLPDGRWFDMGRHHTAAGESTLPRILGMGLNLPAPYAAPGVQVWVDNFALNPVPEPAAGVLWLAGLGMLAGLAARRRSAGVGGAG